MKTLKNVSLKPYNTFGLDLQVPFLYEVETEEDIYTLQQKKIFEKNYFILGGGSNVLFLNVPQYVVHLKTKGICIVNETEDNIWIAVQAGEIWDDFVKECVDKNYGGLENLSLIPGTVGAAPVQNIGAYGVEVKDTLESMVAVNLDSLDKKIFTNDECRFAYRDSIFKHIEYGKWIILESTYKLTKKNHSFTVHYGNMAQLYKNKEINLKNIRQTVMELRNSKLPDPKEIGNAGSFFKNPYVRQDQLNKLLNQYPAMPYFKTKEGLFKIPAAWLIEQCGWKGKRIGNVGTYIKQPLVLVNYGNATAQEIVDFAENVINSVHSKFNIHLDMEVNIV